MHNKCSVHQYYFCFPCSTVLKELKYTINYSSMFDIKLCKCSVQQYFFCFLCSTVLKSQNTQLTTVDSHSMDTGEWWGCWTSHFKRGAEVNSSPRIDISAQTLKKSPAQDSRGAITRDSNISAQTKISNISAGTPNKSVFSCTIE